MQESAENLVINAVGISKHFGGVVALNKVNVDLKRGEVLGLVGDNGAGKSTLIKILSGVIQKDSGQIFIDGKEVTLTQPLDAKREGIETVYQNLALVDIFDVPTNIFLGRELGRRNRLAQLLRLLDRKKMHAEAANLMDRLYLRLGALNQEVVSLSGGQRQAVAISRAVYWGTKIIIFDEPTAALGVKESAKAMELIASLKTHGLPIIMISHNLQHVFDLVDRIMVLRRGERVAMKQTNQVTPEEIVSLITGADRVGSQIRH